MERAISGAMRRIRNRASNAKYRIAKRMTLLFLSFDCFRE
jgi:hypothetical protein